MAKQHRSLTDEQREERRAAQRELVRASVEQLRSSDGWRSYLRARARFRSYSWHNVLLIVCQHPSAERVAGFRAWLDLGYCVTKGSQAIRIWAPCPPSSRQLKQWQAEGADPAQRPRMGWRLVSVFAQDQVAPLPSPAVPVPLSPPMAEIIGDSHAELIERLIALAGELGYTVEFADTGRADGMCDRRARQIRVAARLEPNGRLVALIHELAHALVGEEAEAPKLDYAREELVVESVAWCCCDGVGLDSGANSIPYLASWAERAGLEVLEQTAELTSRLADRIDAALAVSAGELVEVGS